MMRTGGSYNLLTISTNELRGPTQVSKKDLKRLRKNEGIHIFKWYIHIG